MALKPCQGCGRQVDELAKACPGCGRPKATVKPPPAWAYAVVGLLTLGGIVKCLAGGDEFDKARARAEAMNPAARQPFETMTVGKITALDATRNGTDLCTCGFVANTTSAATNTIYLSERNTENGKKAETGLLCVWDNQGEKNSFSLPERSPVCVRGQFQNGFLKPCSIVDRCPW